MPQALILDDDLDFLSSLAELIKREGFSVTTAGTIEEARAKISASPCDLVIADLTLPDGSGIDLLRDVESVAECDVIMVSGHATVDSAVEALRHGALDYLTKPLDIPRLKAVLGHVQRARALKGEVGELRHQLQKLGRFGSLVGTSPVMQHVFDLITRVAPTNASVLITGESGTGKELVAQTIHDLSRRRTQTFIPVNCGAMPASLVESELFGHERGSFTGATALRRGYFERASGGTLFLDEITEMPIELQVKLLRVLETGMLVRIGGDQPVPVDVRIIAATNRVPDEAVRADKLREDLFYRLNVFPIALPPLRLRQNDVPLLAAHFLEQLNTAENTAKSFSKASRDFMATHTWSGNVRELRNAIERAFIMADETIEMAADAPRAGGAPSPSSDGAGSPGRIGTTLAVVEREHILATLEHCGMDKRQAAALLGISLKTLYNRLNLYATV